MIRGLSCGDMRVYLDVEVRRVLGFEYPGSSPRVPFGLEDGQGPGEAVHAGAAAAGGNHKSAQGMESGLGPPRSGRRDEPFPRGDHFENWTGGNARGKEALRQAWEPWFRNHGGFRFVEEDLFIDKAAQKVLYKWTLEWPSPERGFEGKAERRRGVDVIHFREGKIHRKFTKAKTTLEIEGKRVKLSAEPKAMGY